jgi:hypothetical protein
LRRDKAARGHDEREDGDSLRSKHDIALIRHGRMAGQPVSTAPGDEGTSQIVTGSEQAGMLIGM